MVKLPGFCFSSIRFKEIIQKLLQIAIYLYTFCILPSQSSTIASKQLSTKCCSNAFMLFFTAETERIKSLMRKLTQTNFKSIWRLISSPSRRSSTPVASRTKNFSLWQELTTGSHSLLTQNLHLNCYTCPRFPSVWNQNEQIK